LPDFKTPKTICNNFLIPAQITCFPFFPFSDNLSQNTFTEELHFFATTAGKYKAVLNLSFPNLEIMPFPPNYGTKLLKKK
jgi:hypothetical protein